VFAEAGFGDILVSCPVVTRGKVLRLCALSRLTRVSVAVDNPKNVRDLSQAAQTSGSSLRVLVGISTGPESAGVEPGRAAVELAKLAARSRGLEFAGLMTPESVVVREDHQSNGGGPASVLQSVLDTREMVEKAGLEVGTVCTGGLHNYQQAAAATGVTEVPVGGYPLLDYSCCQRLSQFQPAARVVTTVVSRPTDSYAIADAGHKATAPDRGAPVLEGVPGARVTRLSAEHATVELEGAARSRVKVGDKLRLIPMDLDSCVNQYDFIHAIRGGKLEAVWRIAARGRSD
jgi:D-serine deaminase-like pyridoxal phosphate-dependent protein